MKILSAAVLVLCGCSTSMPPTLDGGFLLPDGAVVFLDAGSGPRVQLHGCPVDAPPCEENYDCSCVDAGVIANCPQVLPEAFDQFCPLGMYELRRERCAEGELWTQFAGTADIVGCAFVDGGLVGEFLRNDHGGELRTGTLGLTSCTRVADACGDAGACFPRDPPGQCVSLTQFFARDCQLTEAAQRGEVCADAGTWSRRVCADGGVTWLEASNALGSHIECAYGEGKLRGAVLTSPAGFSNFAGEWRLPGCVNAPLCP